MEIDNSGAESNDDGSFMDVSSLSSSDLNSETSHLTVASDDE